MRSMRDRHHRLIGVSLLIAFASFLLAACSAGPGSGGVIEGTEWILRSYADGDTLAIVPETQYADAEFDRSRVTGLSGCNNYNAVYRQGGRTLLISQPALTLMACDEESMAFEQTFIANLQASRFYSVKRETLTIFGAKGATLLVFDAEQVGRTADAHRREPRERLVPRGLDADPPLDVRADGDGIERGRRGHASDPRERRSMVAASGNGSCRASATTRSATASAAPGRPSERAAADIAA